MNVVWQYQSLYDCNDAELNSAGEDGWELVQVIDRRWGLGRGRGV